MLRRNRTEYTHGFPFRTATFRRGSLLFLCAAFLGTGGLSLVACEQKSGLEEATEEFSDEVDDAKDDLADEIDDHS